MRSERVRVAAAVAALALLASFACAADDTVAPPTALESLRQCGTLEVAVYAEYPPYSFRDSASEPQGIDVDIARALAQRLKLNLKLRMISAGDSVSDDLRNHLWKGHYLGGGVADVMLHVGYDGDFAKQEDHVTLFAPYFHESLAVAYKRARIKQLESPIALTEHRIGRFDGPRVRQSRRHVHRRRRRNRHHRGGPHQPLTLSTHRHAPRRLP